MSSNELNRLRHLVPSWRVEHPVHLVGGQRRSVFLQLGQRFAVGLAELLGNRGFHHRQGLADFHGATLELAETVNSWLAAFSISSAVDLVLRLAGQPLAEPERRPAGKADRECWPASRCAQHGHV